MKKIVLGVLLLGLGVGGLFAARTVDGMAVSYLTGQRRVPGRGFSGEEVPNEGPVPGIAFLGVLRPSGDPPGLRVVRPFETGVELGLVPGDVVTEVGGERFRSSSELMTRLVHHYQAGQTVPLRVAHPGEPPRELTMRLRAFLRNPGDLGLPYEEVEIPSESGYLLRGWFIPPPERSDGRVGVFVHGANASRFQALEHGAKFWYRRGYGLLTMDLSGRGSSEGKYITYTMNERKDVRSMLRWARENPKCARDEVVLFGTSNGAASAIYAAVDDEELPALALDAPYADLWDAAGSMLQSRGVPPWLRYPLAIAVRLRAGLDLRSVRPGDVITRVPAPVLFVHGDADDQVPVAHSKRMHDARERAGLESRIWILPGGEHGFDDYPPEGIFWNRILDFFDEALGGAPPAWDQSS